MRTLFSRQINDPMRAIDTGIDIPKANQYVQYSSDIEVLPHAAIISTKMVRVFFQIS